MLHSARDLGNNLTEIVIKEGVLDLDKTFNCGQCFRWDKLGDGTWRGVVDGDLWMIKRVHSSTLGHDTFLINRRLSELPKVMEYFDLKNDYSRLLERNLSKFEIYAVDFGSGIRILNQDIWETVVSFIISQRNNIPKIKNSIFRLCEKFGTENEYIIRGNIIKYYSFPTPEQIMLAGIDGLNTCGLGYRSEYVLGIAEEFYKNEREFLALASNVYSGNTVVNYLIQYRGIGPKVANCIALFGYNKLDMFPIDVWIQRIIDRYYNGSLDHTRFGELAGLMQQYLFYYIKFNEQES